jgi:hypothetical protein
VQIEKAGNNQACSLERKAGGSLVL